jgi:hypothetical protein
VATAGKEPGPGFDGGRGNADNVELEDIDKAPASRQSIQNPKQPVIGGGIRHRASMNQSVLVEGFDRVT